MMVRSRYTDEAGGALVPSFLQSRVASAPERHAPSWLLSGTPTGDARADDPLAASPVPVWRRLASGLAGPQRRRGGV